MKHRRDTSNDIAIMLSIIDGLRANNDELQAEVNRLRNEIAETNSINIQADEEDKNYRNLTQLNTLLMVLMNMAVPHCDNSPLGCAVAKAIKKYQLTIAKNLAKGTMYIKDDDMEDWEDEDDEDEYGEEEFECSQ
jgi:hypothetical protein